MENFTARRDGFTVSVKFETDESQTADYLGEFCATPSQVTYPAYDRATKSVLHSDEDMDAALDARSMDSWGHREYRALGRRARMRFLLTINTENAAFSDGNHEVETARILQDVALRLVRGDDFSHYRTLFDVNGNDVGRAAFKD